MDDFFGITVTRVPHFLTELAVIGPITPTGILRNHLRRSAGLNNPKKLSTEEEEANIRISTPPSFLNKFKSRFLVPEGILFSYKGQKSTNASFLLRKSISKSRPFFARAKSIFLSLIGSF